MRYTLALFVFLAVVGLWTGPAKARIEGAQPERISYDEFIEKVRAGQIKSISLVPIEYLKGTYSEGDDEREFFARRPLEPGSDPLLTELLEKHKVSVVEEPPPEPNIMAQLAQYGPFVLILPIPSVLLVIVLVYVVRINKKIDQGKAIG